MYGGAAPAGPNGYGYGYEDPMEGAMSARGEKWDFGSEEAQIITAHMEDEGIRKKFARKVLGITTLMLGICSALPLIMKWHVGYPKIKAIEFQIAVAGRGYQFSDGQEKLNAVGGMFMTELNPSGIIPEGMLASGSSTLAGEYAKAPSEAFVDEVYETLYNLRLISGLMFGAGFLIGLATYCAVVSGSAGEAPKQGAWPYILCIVVALSFALQLQFTCFFEATSAVWISVVIASVTVLLLFVFSVAIDLTGGALWISGLVISLLMAAIAVAVVCSGYAGGEEGKHVGTVTIFVFSMASFAFVVYILYGFQRIVGGKNQQHEFWVDKISSDDYALAAALSFAHFFNLFVWIWRAIRGPPPKDAATEWAARSRLSGRFRT